MPIVDRKCDCCNRAFKAKQADVNRGWARFCSKSCHRRYQNETHPRNFLLDNADEGLRWAESQTEGESK